ncbi:VMAP-related conflict system protein [Streptomyces sp. NPDC002668]|uniref:VMAP-related conflict system protein n=1 Tax=Streptomyces sp. NPDC002668 TaxID=3154422 RepID=UPI0033169119
MAERPGLKRLVRPMDNGSRELLDLLGAFVVQVSGPGMRGGSGFFVGSGLIVTCAHVVAVAAAEGTKVAAERARVSWLDGHAEGSVRALPSAHSGNGLWKYPDLALITLDEPVPEHPWAPIMDETPRIGQRLYAAGYSSVYETVPRLGVSAVEYESPLSYDGNAVLQLKSGELAAGKSGGPLLDLERGEVCGVVTTTRRENIDMGGLALPMSAVRSEFPEMWEANQTPNKLDGELWRLRAALQHEYAPASVLSLREEEALLHAAKSSGLQPAALYWRSVHRDYGDPVGPITSMADVLREVADAPAMLDGPHPLLLFIQQVVDAIPLRNLGLLDGLVAAVARRLGVPAPPPTPAPRVVERVAAISVHLDSPGSDNERYLLSVWKYPNLSEPPYAVLCEDRPLTLVQAQEQFRAVVPRAVGDLAEISSHILIEFALPAAKLNAVAVDSWYFSQEWAPVSRQYPVVLRVLDRAPETHLSWVARWRRLQERHAQEPQATIDWVDCHGDASPARLYGWLQQQAALSVLALPFTPEAPAYQHVLETAVYAGLPAAVWTRAGCSGNCPLPSRTGGATENGNDAGDSSGSCAGLRFRQAFEAELAGRTLLDLPDVIRELRIASANTGAGHCGENLVLLWDDATRKLPGDGPALRTPAPHGGPS